MKVIIAGSRTLSPDFDTITAAVEASGFEVTEIICGCAAGVDTAGGQWAEARGIPVKHFPAQWKKFGRRAGPMRTEAASAGFYDSPWGSRHPRLQLLTIEELLAGKGVDRPPHEGNVTFKRAPKVATKKEEQARLL